MTARALTPTSYLLLALMGLRPWSAYELAEQMKRGLQFIWPRAERAFYYEAKRLAELGLAEVADSPVGDRPRAMYTITPAGRDALAAWLANREPSSTQIESEVLARLFFAEYGRVEDARAATECLRKDAVAALRLVRGRSEIYLDSGGEFPERLHLIAFAGRFIADYALMLLRFADWVDEQCADWTDTRAQGKQDATMRTFRSIVADVDEAIGH